MSWNGNDKKDPWGRNDGPPDIDEAVKQLKKNRKRRIPKR